MDLEFDDLNVVLEALNSDRRTVVGKCCTLLEFVRNGEVLWYGTTKIQLYFCISAVKQNCLYVSDPIGVGRCVEVSHIVRVGQMSDGATSPPPSLSARPPARHCCHLSLSPRLRHKRQRRMNTHIQTHTLTSPVWEKRNIHRQTIKATSQAEQVSTLYTLFPVPVSILLSCLALEWHSLAHVSHINKLQRRMRGAQRSSQRFVEEKRRKPENIWCTVAPVQPPEAPLLSSPPLPTLFSSFSPSLVGVFMETSQLLITAGDSERGCGFWPTHVRERGQTCRHNRAASIDLLAFWLHGRLWVCVN